MAEQEHYLVGELARLAGVTPRTIRYYTAEGLLPPPETRGKYARYGAEHLRRLRLIDRMKADYLPLSAIKARLAAMTPAEAEALLARGSNTGERRRDQVPTVPPPHRSPAGSAPTRVAEAGARYNHAPATQPAEGGLDPFHLTPAPLQTGRYEFFPDVPEEPRLDADEDDPQPGLWQRIVLTPGVELHVRGPLSQRRRKLIDELIAAARDRLRAEDY